MNARREQGFSMLEVVIMGVLMSVLLVMITQSVASLSSTRAELRQHSNIGNFADRVARSIESDITFASRLFVDTPDDRAYLAGLTIGPVLGDDVRLPVLMGKGYFEADLAEKRETGNVIAMGLRGQRLSVVVSGSEGDATCLIQTLTIVVYAPIDLGQQGSDLVRWVSEPMVAYWDIEHITDQALRRAVLLKLFDRGLRYAWDTGQPRPTGLFQIEGGGTMAPLPLSALVNGSESESISRPFARRLMRLAANGSLHGIKVPEFAKPAGRFPNGFEVKIDGTGTGKLVLFRYVVESTVQNRRKVFSEVRRMVCTDG